MSECQRILVTGANGFIGSALTKALLKQGFQVRMTGQVRPRDLEALGGEWYPFPDLTGAVDWGPALDGVHGVAHLAGLAHRISVDLQKEREQYNQINHLATQSLATSLLRHSSVERFLFISSVAVYGEPSCFPITVQTDPCPVNPYGQSKLEAELDIQRILAEGHPAWAILRPVLVYGPGNPGNMARLAKLLQRGIPVPVSALPNRRSFLFLGNLVDAISAYFKTQDPPTMKTWIVADEELVSTEALVRAMAEAMNISARILHVPDWLLRSTTFFGDVCCRIGVPAPWNSEVRGKLLGDFYVGIEPIKQELGWKPPFTMKEGFRLTFKR